ncbi:helix-turn-helix domain-containing protein [Amycolatopsis saalfeldensis]|uniref:Helix-turn-helix domain-containing protein n=1 Tax=Amycolatopsis saalfeldensis TaxID=394193 RepID=A0A1H8QR74_9PSEU|nr:helix-turn-helix domain-containing protein [Amycolatopsis saalfeldensis]SEO56719.1 Helix-turn-helix domain-containing protein [Amycolatopsis saalfeldensis]
MAETEWVRFDDVDRGLFVPVAALLQRVRHERGLTQWTVANRAGLSMSYVGGIDGGSRRLRRVETVMRLAHALEIPRDQLFGWVVAEVQHDQPGWQEGGR